MITKEELDQVLHFVSKRWIDLSRDPNHKAFQNMPTDFWMNSIGGGAGDGRCGSLNKRLCIQACVANE